MSEDQEGQEGQDDAAAVAAMVSGGDNEVPEWLLADKYMTGDRTLEQATQEQAKAYKELQGQFGAFTGAPDNYEITLTDAVKEAGGDLDVEDPLMMQAMEFAKNSNMSQESFNELANIFAMSEVAEGNALSEQRDNEIQAMGPNAEQRLNNINSWVNKHMSEENALGLQEAVTTAAGVKAVERLISLTRSAPASVDDARPSTVMSADELHTMQFAKNEYGQLKMSADPEYRKKVEAAFQQKYGTENYQTIVGG